MSTPEKTVAEAVRDARGLLLLAMEAIGPTGPERQFLEKTFDHMPLESSIRQRYEAAEDLKRVSRRLFDYENQYGHRPLIKKKTK